MVRQLWGEASVALAYLKMQATYHNSSLDSVNSHKSNDTTLC